MMKEINHIYTCHIYYEDTDFSGFVYHANYLKFMERAREHALGIENLRRCFAEDLQFVVGSLEIKYIKPAHHGDHLKVITQANLNKSPVQIFKQTIVSVDDPGKIYTDATVKVVSINKKGRSCRVPLHLLQLLG